ncbi:hypothetical protein V5O48_002513 [Marasmius crinis-equi]|uniref:RlpA-like protein double-psi beta-barrel domain-containing protein n=1 Tax=Marasmius crinis-equi TaxID=585013 RepID=A0ABR3FVD3_9AGAR
MFFSPVKALGVAITLLAATCQTQVGAAPAGGIEALEARASKTLTGDATFYDPGLGACGKTNNGGQLIAAVAAPVFDGFPGAGANPNANPICGKKAKVTFKGKSVTVNIVDRCPGCGSSGIDLSPAAFSKLASQSVGRLTGVKWTIA